MHFPHNYADAKNLDSLKAYVETGRPLGGFLTAIVCNDLKGACGQADDVNLRLIPVYVCWLYNEAPGQCWGSPERHAEWLAKFH